MDNHNQEIILCIVRYLSDEATPDDVAKLIGWLRLSDDNRSTFLEYKNMWDVMHPVFDNKEIDTNAALARIVEAIAEKDDSRTVRRKYLKRWVAAVVAIFMLPLIGWGIWSVLHKPAIVGMHEIHAAYGNVTTTVLPDGSEVWLNANSSLSYADDIASAERREVTLKGEGYFDVMSDVSHPFVVKSGDLEVTATGTAFNVNAYGGQLHSSVTLVKGNVSVSNGKKLHRLNCGERYVNDRGGYVETVSDTERYCSWRKGIIMFRDEPLSRLLARIGQIYNVHFEIEDSSAGEELYNATFEGESLDEIISLLQLSTPIVFSKKEVADSTVRSSYIVHRP